MLVTMRHRRLEITGSSPPFLWLPFLSLFFLFFYRSCFSSCFLSFHQTKHLYRWLCAGHYLIAGTTHCADCCFFFFINAGATPWRLPVTHLKAHRLTTDILYHAGQGSDHIFDCGCHLRGFRSLFTGHCVYHSSKEGQSSKYGQCCRGFAVDEYAS